MRTSAILQGRHGHPSALRAFTPTLCAALLTAAIAAPASAAKTGLKPSHLTTLTLAGVLRGYTLPTFTTVPPLAATVDPNGSVTRSDLAFALDHYRQAFAAGN